MKSLLRLVLFPVAAILALTSFAMPDDHGDAKATTENKVDTSKNPITGNTTVTTTSESDVKVGDNTKTKKTKRKQKFNKEGHKIKDTTKSSDEATMDH
jgi:hypothetical protein